MRKSLAARLFDIEHEPGVSEDELEPIDL